MKAYPTYKPSGIDWLGEIPSHWNIISGRYCAEFTYGFPADSVAFSNEKNGIPLIRIRDIFNHDTEVYYEGVDYPQSCIINTNDILIGMDGDFNVARWKGGKALLNQRVCKFQNSKILTQGFIYYYLRLALKIINDSKYATTVKHLSAQDLSDMRIIIPPLSEQEAIVAYLDDKTAKIDALTAEKQTQVDELRKYRTSLITETVTRGLNPDANLMKTLSEFIPQIPEHWRLDKFKYQASIKSNLVHPEGHSTYPQISPDMIEKETGKLINYKNVEEAGIISDNHLFYKGQIIYSKIRPNLNKLIIAPFDGLCSADMYPIETNNNVVFFKYLMLSAPFVNQVSAIISDRVKMPKINQEEMAELLVPIPPLSEQQKIADYLDEKTSKIDELIAELEAQIKELTKYKKAVITEAVTGKVDVRDWMSKEKGDYV